MTSDKVWFSHREDKWKVGWTGKFYWTPKQEIWDWDNCSIGLARSLDDNKLIVVVRSATNKNSSYMGNKPVTLRFMLGFELGGFPSEPKLESSYTSRKNLSKEKRVGPKDRWVSQLDDDHWIWQWAEEGRDIRTSETFRLYRLIRDEIEHPTIDSDNIFDVELERQSDRIIPVIYQPAIDSLKNFVREVHCAEGPKNSDGSYEVEVSIIFENERLRSHGFLNSVYEVIRLLIHRRTKDIESFKIQIRKNAEDNTFTFANIYSDSNGLNRDSIHADKPPPPIPEHKIKYYFGNHRHPIVFVNTSNHAMAEHDANHRLWKWEYVPWLSDASIKLGDKSRREIERNIRQY